MHLVLGFPGAVWVMLSWSGSCSPGGWIIHFGGVSILVGSRCWLSGGIRDIDGATVGGGCRGVGLGSVLIWWPSLGSCILLHLWIGCIGLGLGVAVGIVFSLVGEVFASFLILEMS